MAQLCDRLSPAAALTGAVNTVVNEGGILYGHTTDGLGYLESIRQAGFSPEGRTMTLLGGGGAAVAICTQAALDGMKEIRIFNRKGKSLDRMQDLAEKLCAQTGCLVLCDDLADEEKLAEALRESDILTNASSVGMGADPADEDACLIRDPGLLRPELFVSDIIYQPRQTRLLKMAQQRGCRVAGGLLMLLYQGAQAFRLWTGRQMPAEAVRERFFAG